MAELTALVKRIVYGPLTWSRAPDGTFIPRVQTQLVVPTTPKSAYRPSEARLVRGGRHVLFRNPDVLECWEVGRDHLVWTSGPATLDRRVHEFTAQPNDDGNSLLIFLIIGSSVHDMSCVVLPADTTALTYHVAP
jgi:hypothetical protein